MKHRVFLIAALFAFVLGGLAASAAEEARKIEQFIAKNVDGGPPGFAYFYMNTADSDYHVTAFLTGGHALYLSNGKENAHFGVTKDPAVVYTISRGDYFIVSERLRDRLEGASIHQEIFGSDHCPVELRLQND